jgi:uncharacterized protein (TIGR02271 family)
MLNRIEFLDRFPEFTEGQQVRSRDDENLGKVVSATDDSFMIEKGFFFPKDFVVRYSDISDVRDGVVFLNLDKTELENWREPSYEGWDQVDSINQGRIEATPSAEYLDQYRSTEDRLRTSEEVRVPVAEEELEAHKISRETGSVRLRKVVHTELKHFTIPVMKEEVRIERVPVNEAADAAVTEGSFQESTVSIPIREEEVEIRKRPVVREEVRVTKEQRQEQREVSGEVRKEEVEVQEEGVSKRKKTA